MGTRHRAVVATGATLLAYAAGCTLLAWATRGLTSAPDPADRLGVLLGLAACAAAWAVLTWLTSTLVLAVVAAGLSCGEGVLHRAAGRLVPAAVRHLASLLLGLGLVAAPSWATPPAGAAALGAEVGTCRAAVAPVAAGGRTGPVPLVGDLDRPAAVLPGWTPDRPAAPPSTRPATPVHLVTTGPRPGSEVEEEVVVRRGDTLWDLAARHLGPDASAAEIAVEWPRWYEANRSLVGADPHLIRPGQRLRPPQY